MTYNELCEEYAKTDSFMEPQLTIKCAWWEIDSEEGVIFIDGTSSLVPDMMPFGKWWTINLIYGYGARLSAAGYIDCTDWTVFDTEQEAIDYLAETYLD